MTNRNIEIALFSKRKFLVDTLVDHSISDLDFDSKDFHEKLKLLSSKVYLTFFLISLAISINLLLLIQTKLSGIVEFYNFINNKVYLQHNRFISSDIPLSLTLKAQFKGEFFVYLDKLIPLTYTNDNLKIEVFTLQTNVDIFCKKYGIIKRVKRLNLEYLSNFIITKQNLKVFFKNFEVMNYDYIPFLKLVRGSKVLMFFDFSHNVSNISFSKKSSVEWKYNFKSNSIVINLTANNPIEFDLIFYDVFGRKIKIDAVRFDIITNDIPIVNIKYPERDLTFLSSFVLEGEGDVYDTDKILNLWMDVTVSNSLTGSIKKLNVFNKNGGIIFSSHDNDFRFVIDSLKSKLLPGDNLVLKVIAEDIYGGIGFGTRKIYLPTFSEVSRIFNEELDKNKNLVSELREKLAKTIYDLNKNKLNVPRLIEELKNIQNSASNLSLFSEKLSDIYNSIDRSKGLFEEFQRLNQISEKLQNILNDREFKEIMDKLYKEKSFDPSKVSKKIEDVSKVLTELEMEINRLNEFRDILKMISNLREIENLSLNNQSLNEDNLKDKLESLLKNDEFNRMSEDFKSSFVEKLKNIEKSLKEKKFSKEDIVKFFEELDFEVFKEAMKRISEISKKQKDKFWDVYFGVLKCQISLTEAKKSIDIKGMIYPNINLDNMKSEFDIVSRYVKEFRLIMRNFIKNFSLIPSTASAFLEINYHINEIDNDFNFFTDAVSSGTSHNISQSVANMVNRISFVISKLLDFLDSMNEGINLQPQSTSLSEILEMYRQISKMLKEMLENGIGNEKLNELKKLLEDTINKARELQSKNPGDSRSKDIVEKLEDMLRKIEERKLNLAYEQSKNIEFNLLEYQKGMFEKGLLEKREAERPRIYKVDKPKEIIEFSVKKKVIGKFIREKYLDIVSKYKKILNE